MNCDIHDPKLASAGRQRILWADRNMPVLKRIRERFDKEKPLDGYTIGACLHVTTETANLMRTLKAGGARVLLCASNPLSTQDSTAASLVEDYGIEVFAIRGEDRDTYYKHIQSVISAGCHVTMDDGADVVSTLHSDGAKYAASVLGGTEETTTGVIRLRSMEKDSVLKYPIIAVNDAITKHFFDNRYGTGQSTIDGVLRATNMLIAGSTVVVAGYGWCGRGLAYKARGMGGHVIVTEVDPFRALEASMDGFRVLPMKAAAPIGDLFVTVTGDCSVIRKEHFEMMKDGAVVANSGHFDVELDLVQLGEMAVKREMARPLVEGMTLANGRTIFVLAEGRLVNLSAAEGHPACVMDMSFANQSLSAEYIIKNHEKLERKVYPVPKEMDRYIASLKLETLGIEIDTLTPEQVKYLSSWDMGT
ncbi:MAG: adenosylhomocysteinase [Candidatus Eisenbacteria bacterium]|uniref:Adenosylhomocysteinase n=1 Tax=Eiseniibacteriota bacterium TaxID=2212470 RepID=A0A948RRU6_UNCEI|nr:adenosylhomocysteinase [Candidatus Eisenbacteria bacterium]MBU1950128.1 adenosylhomocysteinase [Candidatus Eisenbacteria bacterium]MBU2689838.1 adenosylhomocysteinase [Candidatus Eisenbacteria bacterium]